MDTALPPAAPELFGRVFVLSQHLANLSDDALAPLGITTRQWLLIAILQRAFEGRRPTLSEAAAVYGSSRQNIKVIARGLEERGFVRLVGDPDDRRAVRLELTSKMSVFDAPEWRAREVAFLAELFSGLTSTDVDELRRLVDRWLESIDGRRPGHTA